MGPLEATAVHCWSLCPCEEGLRPPTRLRRCVSSNSRAALVCRRGDTLDPSSPARFSQPESHAHGRHKRRAQRFVSRLLRQPCPAMARSQPVARHSLATLALRAEGTVQRHAQAAAHARRAGVRMSLMPRVGRPTWLRRRALGRARPRRARAVGGLAWLALRCCGRDRPRGSLRELPGAIPRSEANEAVGGEHVARASVARAPGGLKTSSRLARERATRA